MTSVLERVKESGFLVHVLLMKLFANKANFDCFAFFTIHLQKRKKFHIVPFDNPPPPTPNKKNFTKSLKLKILKVTRIMVTSLLQTEVPTKKPQGNFTYSLTPPE